MPWSGILKKCVNACHNSQFWLKFTILTEIHNFNWNSQFRLKLTISTEFHSLDWNSQFWLNFTISSEIPNFDWNSQFGLRSHLACRSISWVRSVLVSFRTQLGQPSLHPSIQSVQLFWNEPTANWLRVVLRLLLQIHSLIQSKLWISVEIVGLYY